MPLTVLNVAYPLAPVGPGAVGGAEQVLSSLDSALVQAGHRSIVIACEGSQTEGTLLPVPRNRGELDDTARRSAWACHRNAIQQALRHWPIDVVHLHGVDCREYLPSEPVPTLITLHLPPEWYPPELFTMRRVRTFLHCVSRSQERACPSSSSLLPAIPNGVSTDRFFPDCKSKGRFVLCLGRICPEKGFHLALAAARQAHLPLLLAGEVFRYPAHQLYFQTEILPLLDRCRRFIGPVGFERKRRLLSAARCLLVPSLVPETSSLVAMEALACGTPVIAFPSGALSELVEHGQTGFLVTNEREMAQAMNRCLGLSSETCRASAQTRFPLRRMITKYFELYRQLADSSSPCQSPDWQQTAARL